MRYFNGVTDLESGRRLRRKLAMKYHPDRHPDTVEEYTRIWQQVEAEYSDVVTILKHHGSLNDLLEKIGGSHCENERIPQTSASPEDQESPLMTIFRSRTPSLFHALFDAGMQWIIDSVKQVQASNRGQIG